MINGGCFKVFIDGRLVDEGSNTITNRGRRWLLDVWKGESNIVPWMTNGSAYVAVGEGSGLTTASMSGLVSELGAGSVSRAEFTGVSRVVDAGSSIIGSVSFGGSGARGALWEVGVFVTGYDSSNSLQTVSTTKDTGILFARKTFDSEQVINSGTVLSFQYEYSLWDS